MTEVIRNSLFESCESARGGIPGSKQRDQAAHVQITGHLFAAQICIDLSPELGRQNMVRRGNIGEEVRTVPGVDLSVQ